MFDQQYFVRNIFSIGIAPTDRQPIVIPGRVESRLESGWPVPAHSGVIRQTQVSAIFITPGTHLSAATRRCSAPTFSLCDLF